MGRSLYFESTTVSARIDDITFGKRPEPGLDIYAEMDQGPLLSAESVAERSFRTASAAG